MDQTIATPTSLLDAYAPAQIAMRVREVGVTKAAMPVLTMFALAVLAEAFIALGALFYTVTMTTRIGDAVPFGLHRLAGVSRLVWVLSWWWSVERNSLPAIT